ncbi:importin-beta amine-terminal domain protein (macronuclear) [Tetrahymena thermophila SB210]|uniref:Importin-beta amine-terminal domain protein n=1 Tax=Tetrahymena thermophila (strain SB210) TaxID=312017 RepID=Q22RS7_TETTS|nr:importin-beta amine-terminal domain protein [Tetrahymena thermophila SB210]EAR88045.3 importin-beta amine-terminal domain protein [Tetrahymena thermophila SB210]|eukprot:XP_001008290.3 importin-beta amine-terminal domain protein [Tetrahymena thermophila SB210]
MSDFNQLLNTVMTGGADRAQAEKQLEIICMNDTSSFFKNLVNELYNEGNSEQLRQLAGTLIKRSVRLEVQGKYLWNVLDSNLRESIKNTLLQVMIVKFPSIQRACANAISTIFTVEVIEDRWLNLIDDLANSTQPTITTDIRKAAILTLGQICDKLKEFRLGNKLVGATKEKILMAILIGLSPDEQDLEIRENSIIALGDCVEFMTDILEAEQVRDYTAQLLITALQHPDQKIKVAALQRSSDFVKAIYIYFTKYVSAFFSATQGSILHNDEDICIPAMEIWSTLANEYHERDEKNHQVNRVDVQAIQNPNHILLVQEQLVQCLLQNLLKNDMDDDSEAESAIQEASQKALCSIVESVGDAVVNTFTAFITNTLTNSEWTYRQGAILAFGSLMEGISENVILDLITKAFSEYVKTLNDPVLKVQESGAKLLSKIAEYHPKAILLRQNISNDLPVIVESLKQIPSISRQICWFFCFLAENLDKYPQNFISQHFDILVESLIKNAIRSDLGSGNYNVIDVSFMSALNIIHYSRAVNIGYKYLNFFLTLFKDSYAIQPIERRNAIQSGILSALHACLLTLDDKFDPNMSDTVFQLVVDHFMNIKNVDSDGMYIVSALATCIGTNFVKYLDKVWPYIEHALTQRQQDLELFKTCMGTIADVARACDNQFSCKLNILNNLFAALESPQFNRDVKLNIFSCIGDICLATKENTLPYLENLVKIFDIGFTAAVELSRSDQQDIQDYSEQLKEKLIESYTCVLHGINDTQQNPTFFNHCPKLVEFITLTCDKNLHPTVDYVRNCLTLLVDIGNFYKNQVGPYIKTNFTKYLIDVLQEFDQSEEGKETISFAHRVNKTYQFQNKCLFNYFFKLINQQVLQEL